MNDIFSLFVAVFLTLIAVGFLRTYFLENTDDQKTFSAGKIPTKLPDGLYHGSAAGYNGSWQGKKFNRADKTGINEFKNADKLTERFSFKTYVAKGVRDNQDVIKIDYNIPENPWYLRLILDEIVEVGPDTYLGKLQVRCFPNFYFTFAYFSLEKK